MILVIICINHFFFVSLQVPPKSATESIGGGGGGERGTVQATATPRVRGELDVSTEVLLEGPELMLRDPTSSLTAKALSGMLAAQVALQVSMPLVIIYSGVHLIVFARVSLGS